MRRGSLRRAWRRRVGPCRRFGSPPNIRRSGVVTLTFGFLAARWIACWWIVRCTRSPGFPAARLGSAAAWIGAPGLIAARFSCRARPWVAPVHGCLRAPSPQGQPGFAFIREIVASPAALDVVTIETNGLGLPYAQVLQPALRSRDETLGGAVRLSETVMLGVEDFERAMDARSKPASPWRRPGPKPFRTRSNLIHVSQASKTAAYGALRLMLDREQLLIPRAAEYLVRELLLLKVELLPSGGERIEASSGHDDLADALVHALGPHPVGDRWRVRLADFADKRVVIRPDVDCDDDPGAFQSCNGTEVTRPASDRGRSRSVSASL